MAKKPTWQEKIAPLALLELPAAQMTRAKLEAKLAAVLAAAQERPIRETANKIAAAIVRKNSSGFAHLLAENPTEYNRLYKRKQRFKAYGINEEDFAALWKEQGGKCAICKSALTPACHVDHDHEVGGVRGLLCSGCNTGLGFFKDNEVALQSAAEYLRSYRELYMRILQSKVNP